VEVVSKFVVLHFVFCKIVFFNFCFGGYIFVLLSRRPEVYSFVYKFVNINLVSDSLNFLRAV
jgi:hypothetical protein